MPITKLVQVTNLKRLGTDTLEKQNYRDKLKDQWLLKAVREKRMNMQSTRDVSTVNLLYMI